MCSACLEVKVSAMVSFQHIFNTFHLDGSFHHLVFKHRGCRVRIFSLPNRGYSQGTQSRPVNSTGKVLLTRGLVYQGPVALCLRGLPTVSAL